MAEAVFYGTFGASGKAGNKALNKYFERLSAKLQKIQEPEPAPVVTVNKSGGKPESTGFFKRAMNAIA